MSGLYNDAKECVEDSLRGYVACNSHVRLLDERIVIRSSFDSDKVTIISGGGSGHEPAHIGYVGQGMLTAAVCGPVFTSPPVKDILSALRAVNNRAGVLMIVKNYTGDRLNFGLALMKAKNGSYSNGLPMADIQMVIVGEDMNGQSDRGLCGTIFMHKIAGAMAEQGKSLTDIKNYLDTVVSMGTIGLGLSSCRLPGRSADSFFMTDGEMELGLGIHGEAGVIKYTVFTAKHTVALMLDRMFEQDKYQSLAPYKDNNDTTKIALIVNNLGSTTDIQLSIVAKEAILYLENGEHDLKYSVVRLYCGKFMSSLNMAGISLSVLFLNEKITNYLDHSTKTSAWPNKVCSVNHSSMIESEIIPEIKTSFAENAKVTKEIGNLIHSSLSSVCRILSMNVTECLLNEYDSFSGDGDCGTTFKRFATAIESKILTNEDSSIFEVPSHILDILADCASDHMGGTSGAFYYIFLKSMSEHLEHEVTTSACIKAFGLSIDRIMQYGGAKIGDRTMVDALHTFHITFIKESGKDFIPRFNEAVEESEKWTNDTIDGNSKVGRQSYVRKPEITHPDPGAYAVVLWLKAIYSIISKK